MKGNRKRNKKRKKVTRASGDAILYFFLHNIISLIFFFALTINLDIYSGTDIMMSYVFSGEFWYMALVQVFLIYILSSVIGRVMAYLTINLYCNIKERPMKRWSELNRGINKLGLVFLLTGIVTSIIYSLGLVAILQNAIFNENTLITLIIIYMGFKLGTFVIIRWFVGAKL
ncbi:hypothetical protein LCGC14_2265140 [marine sediment metagenome]|uniref:Uncharacterized protein n=1 Tax=marine sediment metagenome TaxID=412755 RepID=A0A0F9FAX9_9ZZZZ